MRTTNGGNDSSVAQDYIRQILSAREQFNSLSSEAAILFADLVGSTEFKRHHSEREGLEKTALHNAVITDCILAGGGVVSKYLGDGVLATFEGQDGPCKCLNAAISCLAAISKANESQGWRDYERGMSTKIGIDFGAIWKFRFPQATVDDPQGSVVDLASRLAGLASPNQIVITDKACQIAVQRIGTGIGGCTAPTSDVISRLVRGLKDPIALRAIGPNGKPVGDIYLDGHHPTPPGPMDAKLNEGRTALESGNSEKALEIFTEVSRLDRGCFEANYRAAELLLANRPKNKHDEKRLIEAIIQHLSLAMQSCPRSPRVWYLSSWAHFKRFELLREFSDLDLAVRFAESALDQAYKIMDVDGMILSKTCLARKLLERSQWGENETDNAKDLLQAARLCNEVSRVVSRVHKETRAEYLVTHALVRLEQGDTAFEEIEKMIQEAETLNPQNDKLDDAKRRLRDVQVKV